MKIILDNVTKGIHPWQSRSGEVEIEIRLQDFFFDVIKHLTSNLTGDIRKIIKTITGHFEHWAKNRQPDSEDLRLVLVAKLEPNRGLRDTSTNSIIIESPRWTSGVGWERQECSGFIIFPEFKLGSRMVNPKEVADDFTNRIITALTQHSGTLEWQAKKLTKILEECEKQKDKVSIEP